MPLIHKARILDADEIERMLRRLASEIVEHDGGSGELVLIGICRRGVPLAQRLARAIAASEGASPPVGVFDIGFYRDDLSVIASQPQIRRTDVPVPLSGKCVVLVDDVLYTGRTIRAAMNVLFDLGQPSALRLAVLVDRGHRALPIQADFVGRFVPTSRREVIEVRLAEVDGREEVWIMELVD